MIPIRFIGESKIIFRHREKLRAKRRTRREGEGRRGLSELRTS
jgi:hypothetical protein